MMAMWEYGLLDHWVEEAFHIPGAEKCFVKEKSTKKAAIKLVDLTGAFLPDWTRFGHFVLLDRAHRVRVPTRNEGNATGAMQVCHGGDRKGSITGCCSR